MTKLHFLGPGVTSVDICLHFSLYNSTEKRSECLQYGGGSDWEAEDAQPPEAEESPPNAECAREEGKTTAGGGGVR